MKLTLQNGTLQRERTDWRAVGVAAGLGLMALIVILFS